MSNNRQLNWEGSTNMRDLGGLKTSDGRQTRWGAVVRAEHPYKLTAAGWEALYAYGIRTIVWLRTHGQEEEAPDITPRPADLTNLRVEIEDFTDAEFMEQWVKNNLFGTPLYFRDALLRWPQRHTAALSTIARARPGGVLIHCMGGIDRTGIISLLLLSVAGVSADDIIADYETNLDDFRKGLLTQAGSSPRQAIQSVLDWLDIDAYLRSGGLSEDDLSALRARLLEPAGGA